MNAGSGTTRDPVENMRWNRLDDGTYTIRVHQFALRETTQIGFEIDVALGDHVMQFNCPTSPRSNQYLDVLEFDVALGEVIAVRSGKTMNGGNKSQEKWGVTTGSLVPVSTIMMSPNHWDGAGGHGNRHWFFMLETCRNPDTARGFYNEFLNGLLHEHRKVFEVLGSKMRCAASDEQLSGLGFSSTRESGLVVTAATGNKTRAYNIAI